MSADRDGGWDGNINANDSANGNANGHEHADHRAHDAACGDGTQSPQRDPSPESASDSGPPSSPASPSQCDACRARRPDAKRGTPAEDHLLYYGAGVPKRPARDLASPLANPEIRLMNESDLAKLDTTRAVAGTAVLAATPLVEVTPDGSRLESRPFHGLALSAERRRRGTLVVGATGSGKTYRYALNMIHALLRDTDESILYNNLKGRRGTDEIRHLVERTAPGTEVIVFAPGNGGRSVGINMLRFARRHGFEATVVAHLLAAIQSGREGTNYWELTAKPVFEAVMRYPEIDSLAAMYELFSNTSLFDGFARRTGDHDLLEFTAYRSSGSNGATSGVDLAGRVAPLCATDSARAVASGADEFDPVDCIRSSKRFVLVIECSESTYRTEKHLVSLFLTLWFQSLLKVSEDHGGTLPRGVNMIIDEFGVTPRIPDLADTLNLGRSRGYAFVGLVQSVGQLRSIYDSDAESLFAGFCSTVWFCSGLAVVDRECASRIAGNIVVKDWSTTMRENSIDGAWEADSRTSRSAIRPLLLPEDFMISDHPNFGGYAVAFPVDSKPAYIHFAGAWESDEIKAALDAAAARPAADRAIPLPAVPRRGLIESGHRTTPVRPGHPQVSDTSAWPDERVREHLAAVMDRLDWSNTTGSARNWWLSFLSENKERPRIVLRLAEELEVRRATITEFFLAYIYSNTDNIQANLHYLDYTRLKKEEERKKREAAEERRRADAARATEEARKQPSEAFDAAVDAGVNADVDVGLESEIDALRRLVEWPKPAKPRARSGDKLRLLDAWASGPGRSRDEVLRLMREIFNLGWKARDLAATMHYGESSDPWEVLKQMGRRSDGTGA